MSDDKEKYALGVVSPEHCWKKRYLLDLNGSIESTVDKKWRSLKCLLASIKWLKMTLVMNPESRSHECVTWYSHWILVSSLHIVLKPEQKKRCYQSHLVLCAQYLRKMCGFSHRKYRSSLSCSWLNWCESGIKYAIKDRCVWTEGISFAVLHKTVDREGSCNHTAVIGGDIDPTEIAGIAGPLRLQFVPCYLSYH